MKRILLIFILILNFQSWTKADDIRDFEIEGMSVGDSALDYFDKERIDERKKVGFIYQSKKFYSATLYNDSKFELYNHVQFHIKKNDNKYIIQSIGGQIDYPNNIGKCYNELEKISVQFKKDFDYIDYYDSGIVDHMDKTSGTVRSIFVTLRKKNEIVIECYDYNKETEKNGKIDHLTIAIDSKEFSDWLKNEAY
ncbi:hypothetical protein [Candidatus Pelagibacter sp. Uisw_127]|uniref:hypothetical protein n=1 Tax=Candidatus Pelagibacter sp. Uisw_127 TaxID=3230988 RepID=UPI0039EB7B61